MVIPIDIENKIKSILLSNKGKSTTILDIQHVSGGCINNASKIITNCDTLFFKWNKTADDKMFEVEAKGLELIRKSNTIYTPNLIAYDNHFLMTEFIEKASPTHSLWEEFGRNLSELHKVSNIDFGLDHDNFIGSLLQKNNQQPNWIDFFINQRLIQQLSIGNFSSELTRGFDKLFLKIEDLFPNEPSSLLHGDLWNGNFLIYKNKTVLIDGRTGFKGSGISFGIHG